MKLSFEGVVAGFITPFLPDGSIDWEIVARESQYLDKSPVHGICLGGVLSGMAGAAPEEFFALAKKVRKTTAKPLAAMLFPDTLLEAHELMRAVADGGATTILVAQPHYLCQPTHNDLADMFADLRRSSAVPILVADCLPDAPLGVAGIRVLMEGKVIDGVLEGHDAHVLVDLLALRSELPIFCGIEDLHYLGLLLGARGAVSDLAAAFPQEMVDLYRNGREGSYSAARNHHERLCRLWRALNSPVERSTRLRVALAAQGRSVGSPRSPYDLADDNIIQTVQSALKQEGLAWQSH